jgi:hypothetical protein
MRRSVDRFCGACGYEFPRDDVGDSCRMCARYERLRMEAAALRPGAYRRRESPTAEPPENDHPLQAVGPPITQSEYGVVFRAYRARAAAAKRRIGSTASIAKPTPTQPQPPDGEESRP